MLLRMKECCVELIFYGSYRYKIEIFKCTQKYGMIIFLYAVSAHKMWALKKQRLFQFQI